MNTNTVSVSHLNTMKRMVLLKRIEACRRVKRSLLPSYMDGFHQSMVLDAQIASLTKEMEELFDPRRKPVRH